MSVVVTWLVTSPRLPAGLLTAHAWDVLRSAPVVAAAANSDQTTALAAFGVDITIAGTTDAASTLTDAGGVWIASPDGDDALAEELARRMSTDPTAFTLEQLVGSWDPPGAKLLDLVAVIDRLRSPGGCPWDGEQTHRSLAPYLLEETYETLDAIDTGDAVSLREELGDLLIQPLLHARIAAEAQDGFGVDEVAGDVVEKLVRRHPHVFAGEELGDRDAYRLWDRQKRAEKTERRYATDGVPRALPALALAGKYLSRIKRAGVEIEAPSATTASTTDAVASPEALGEALLALVAEASDAGLDPELALRAAAERHAAAARAIEDKNRP
ncbi:MazG family protein [Stackebrandtia soli]|uniref:MazG family protein n=1 Tax=Stackebrandtia soli TaxID=1892856 RepID=UPI0039EA2317